jgi:hypothetical protein
MGALRSSGAIRNTLMAYLGTGASRAQGKGSSGGGGGGTAFVQGGNSFAAPGVIGTNDANPLLIRTNGVTRAEADTSGNFLANSFDTLTATGLTVGGTNATSITVGGSGHPGFTATTGALVWTSNANGSFSFGAAFALDVPTGFNLNIGANNAGELINIGLASSTIAIAGSTITIGGTSTTALTIEGTTTMKDVNGNTWLTNSAVASAVNFVTVSNAATGGNPKIAATGTDANVGLAIATKGTGVIAMTGGNTTAAFVQMQNIGVGLTTSVLGATGIQLGGTGQSMVLFVNNTGGATTSGCATFAGGDNSGTSRIIVDFREAAALGTVVGSIAITTAATAFNTSSDRRLKKDIVDTQRGLAEILKMRVRDFGFKVDADGVAKRTGFIAQELIEVVPSAVTVEAEGAKYMQVDYSKLTPYCVRAIQQLHARIEQLEARLAA